MASVEGDMSPEMREQTLGDMVSKYAQENAALTSQVEMLKKHILEQNQLINYLQTRVKQAGGEAVRPSAAIAAESPAPAPAAAQESFPAVPSSSSSPPPSTAAAPPAPYPDPSPYSAADTDAGPPAFPAQPPAVPPPSVLPSGATMRTPSTAAAATSDHELTAASAAAAGGGSGGGEGVDWGGPAAAATVEDSAAVAAAKRNIPVLLRETGGELRLTALWSAYRERFGGSVLSLPQMFTMLKSGKIPGVLHVPPSGIRLVDHPAVPAGSTGVGGASGGVRGGGEAAAATAARRVDWAKVAQRLQELLVASGGGLTVPTAVSAYSRRYGEPLFLGETHLAAAVSEGNLAGLAYDAARNSISLADGKGDTAAGAASALSEEQWARVSQEAREVLQKSGMPLSVGEFNLAYSQTLHRVPNLGGLTVRQAVSRNLLDGIMFSASTQTLILVPMRPKVAPPSQHQHQHQPLLRTGGGATAKPSRRSQGEGPAAEMGSLEAAIAARPFSSPATRYVDGVKRADWRQLSWQLRTLLAAAGGPLPPQDVDVAHRRLTGAVLFCEGLRLRGAMTQGHIRGVAFNQAARVVHLTGGTRTPDQGAMGPAGTGAAAAGGRSGARASAPNPGHGPGQGQGQGQGRGAAAGGGSGWGGSGGGGGGGRRVVDWKLLAQEFRGVLEACGRPLKSDSLHVEYSRRMHKPPFLGGRKIQEVVEEGGLPGVAYDARTRLFSLTTQNPRRKTTAPAPAGAAAAAAPRSPAWAQNKAGAAAGAARAGAAQGGDITAGIGRARQRPMV